MTRKDYDRATEIIAEVQKEQAALASLDRFVESESEDIYGISGTDRETMVNAVWQEHEDRISELVKEFEMLGSCENCSTDAAEQPIDEVIGERPLDEEETESETTEN